MRLAHLMSEGHVVHSFLRSNCLQTGGTSPSALPPLRPCPVALTNLARRNWPPGLLPVHNRSRFPLWRMRLSQFRLSKPGLSIASVAAFQLRLALTGFGLVSPAAATLSNPHGEQLAHANVEL